MAKYKEERPRWSKKSDKSGLTGKTLTHLKDLLSARQKELRNQIGWRKRSQESHEQWIKRDDERILALTKEVQDIAMEINRRD